MLDVVFGHTATTTATLTVDLGGGDVRERPPLRPRWAFRRGCDPVYWRLGLSRLWSGRSPTGTAGLVGVGDAGPRPTLVDLTSDLSITNTHSAIDKGDREAAVAFIAALV